MLSLSSRHASATARRAFSSQRAVGIVGMPNIGKSTLFNALTRTQKAQAANYPFCTIEPNVARVSIPDKRLDMLAKLCKSQKTIYSQLEFVDIAGLVRGAAEGKGLGNKFLGNIRETSAIVHLLRCFKNDDIIHVEEAGVDPVRDLHTIEGELILSDLQTIEKRLENADKRKQKAASGGATASEASVALLRKIQAVLESGTPVSRAASAFEASERRPLDDLHLLSSKPVIYVCNVDEQGAKDGGNDMTRAVQNEISKLDASAKVTFCARLGDQLGSQNSSHFTIFYARAHHRHWWCARDSRRRRPDLALSRISSIFWPRSVSRPRASIKSSSPAIRCSTCRATIP
jgi:GTP-binding protein YchF